MLQFLTLLTISIGGVTISLFGGNGECGKGGRYFLRSTRGVCCLFISRFFLSNAFPFCFITLRNSYHVSDVVSSIDKNVVRDYNYTVYSVQINFEEFKILSGLRIEAIFFSSFFG